MKFYVRYAFCSILFVFVSGCTSYHNLKTDGENSLGGGFFDKKIADGFYKLTVKTNFSPFENYSSARSTWNKRAKELCNGSDFENINTTQHSYNLPAGRLYVISQIDGYFICLNTLLSEEDIFLEMNRKHLHHLRLANVKNQYIQLDATIVPPKERGWLLMSHSDRKTVFVKENILTRQTIAVITLSMQLDTIKFDSNFLKNIIKQRIELDNKERFKILKVMYEQFNYLGMPCIEYSSLSEDHGSIGINSLDFLFFKTKGYICKTKFNQSSVFLMELSQRSDSAIMPKKLIELATDFFSKIKFTK